MGMHFAMIYDVMRALKLDYVDINLANMISLKYSFTHRIDYV